MTTLTTLDGTLRAIDGALVLSAEACCCEDECTPCVLARKITNESDPVWDLTPYACMLSSACAGRPWRLIERCRHDLNGLTTDFTQCSGLGILYSAGTVDENGCLEGLPNEFVSQYAYDGCMYLELGCIDPETSEVVWPDCEDANPIKCACGLNSNT